MPNSQSPFSGIKLSEDTPLNGRSVDQQLFSASSASPALQPKTGRRPLSADSTKLETQETRKIGSQETRKETSNHIHAAPPEQFDINKLAYKKVAFVFTGDEFEALEDMKIQIRRRFDIKAIKNDLVRCAIHMLIEDYQLNGETSLVVRRLGNKRVR